METRTIKKLKKQAKALGFRVTEDCDQPGFWVWINDSTNSGCDSSFRTESEAWRDVFHAMKGMGDESDRT